MDIVSCPLTSTDLINYDNKTLLYYEVNNNTTQLNAPQNIRLIM